MHHHGRKRQRALRGTLKRILAPAVVLLVAGPTLATADTMDALLNKFVEKGVLTRADANEISAQSTQEKAAEQKSKLPDWIYRTSLKGDFRLRYQQEDRSDADQRSRGRFRYRLSLSSEVRDDLKVIFGLASGSSDPRSTNQTFQDTFSSKPVQIDLAYAQYKPAKWLDLRGGKMSNPLWTPADLLWDSDIRPEGAAVTLQGAVAEGLDLFVNGDFFVLDEYSDQEDPLMFAVQGGGGWKFMENARLELAATYYGFSSVKGHTLDYSAGTNTLENGELKYEYNSIAGGAELAFTEVTRLVPYVEMYGEYIYNPDPSTNNSGFLAGAAVGHAKTNGLGRWQAKYNYRRLERDAWLDVFPDSDFFGGATDVKGHEVILECGLAEHVTAGIDYYRSESISTDVDESLFQADLVFKF